MTRSGWAIVVAAFACTGCATLKEQEGGRGSLRATPRPPRVANASFDGLQLQCDFAFENTSPTKLTLAQIDYTLVVEGTPVADGKAGQDTRLEPGARATATAKIDVTFDKLRKAVPALAGKPHASYVLDAIALLKTQHGGELRVPLRRGGSLFVLTRPRVELARLAVRHLEVATGRLDLLLRVTNPNAFTAQIKTLACDVDLDGARVGRIDLTPNKAIAPGAAAEFVGPLPLDFRSLGPALHTAIASGAVNVRVTGSARVLTPYGEPTFAIDMTRKTRARR